VAALAADDSGAYVAVNDAAAQLTGFDVSTLQRMSVWDMTPPVDERTADRLWAAFLEVGEQRGVYTLRGRTGPVNAAYLARAHVLPQIHVSLLVPVQGR